MACGLNHKGQCDIPPLDQEISYTQVVAGHSHTVFLRSDGSAVACRVNSAGQCEIPPLDEGLLYTQVAAGFRHTVIQCFCKVMAAFFAVVKMTVVNATFRVWFPVRAMFGIACRFSTGWCSLASGKGDEMLLKWGFPKSWGYP